MRRLAQLLIVFRAATDDVSLCGDDMLDRALFPRLDETLEQVNKSSSARLTVST